jgi:hypothetical protein
MLKFTGAMKYYSEIRNRGRKLVIFCGIVITNDTARSALCRIINQAALSPPPYPWRGN